MLVDDCVCAHTRIRPDQRPLPSSLRVARQRGSVGLRTGLKPIGQPPPGVDVLRPIQALTGLFLFIPVAARPGPRQPVRRLVQIIRRLFIRADNWLLAFPSHTVVDALVLWLESTLCGWLEFLFLLWKAFLLMLGE